MDALTAIFSILYPFWLLIPLFGLGRLFQKGIPFSQRVQRGLRATFIAWLAWAFFWGFLLWRGREPIMFMPETMNNFTFILLGSVSGGISLVWMIWRWRERRIKLTNLKKLEGLLSLSPDDFEGVVADIFDFLGYRVEQVGGTSDHGVDIVVTNDEGEKWIVQCKRYSGSVGEPVVRELYGTLLHEEASGAYLMTTGTFTQGAKVWATGKPLMLYDGELLVQLIQNTLIRKN